ncbi:MAG: asparagine synthase (glutamine-hydrolyzing) [Spirochaetae bacterium HGW-Spirochaetae-1]|jgi:asparagine synthase (glutamine-hydrolysing)|nr:MAG: asparagine synthase (glutamine-hydrolyzing) [Spirochaetae bacterium HGW-Spirochaetae-1]
MREKENMCGIVGIYNRRSNTSASQKVIADMIKTLHHRGPDETGFYCNGPVALGHSRLSIIDLSGGSQPIYNEDRSIVVVFNGEIFNYIELRETLVKQGHSFYTHSDTEVIVHLYEQYGLDFVHHMNGQFAIALRDEKKKSLVLVRDRLGIRPVFYTVTGDGSLIFGSEMKAIFQHPMVNPEFDPAGLNEVFSLWGNIPPRTVFKNISELAPGCMLMVSGDRMETRQYWDLDYPEENEYDDKPIQYYVDGLRELIYDATTIRLRADVPVAAYLSGGLDSSVIAGMVKKHHNNDLITFSVAFDEKDYDESDYQMQMVEHIGTDHHIIRACNEDIGEVFSDVVRYSEKPLIRTAPGPLFLLSRLVRSQNIKVVLTGEGADEVFGGYNIFKEDKIRRFWARNPLSVKRPKLLQSLYPYIKRDPRTFRFWQAFFKKGLTDTGNPWYSHMIRWDNTAQVKSYFSDAYREYFNGEAVLRGVEQYLNPAMMKWHPLCRAQYIESKLFLPGYLLSSQGDRMMMGNSVEGRFPFLDYRVVEFAAKIPPKYKIYGLNEKYVLKKAYQDMLPPSIVNRPKQPYRAPISHCFKKGSSLSAQMLEDDSIDSYGIFDAASVRSLKKKVFNDNGSAVSARDDMAVAGIISTQLLHHHFVASPRHKG